MWILLIAAILMLGLFAYWKSKQPAHVDIPQRKPETTVEDPSADTMNFERLPDYDKTEAVLMVKDPDWLFSYWEISAATREEMGSLWNKSQPVLRLYDLTALPEGTIPPSGAYEDVPINDFANNWYIYVGRPRHTFAFDLGRKFQDGTFISLARSNTVTTPANTFSEVIDPLWPPSEAIWNIIAASEQERKVSGQSSPALQQRPSSKSLIRPQT